MGRAALVEKAINASKSVAKDITGVAARYKVSKGMLIGATAGAGLFAASRLSNNKYIRGAGDVAGLGALGVGGYVGGRYAWDRWGSKLGGKAFASSIPRSTGLGADLGTMGKVQRGQFMAGNPEFVPAYQRRYRPGAVHGGTIYAGGRPAQKALPIPSTIYAGGRPEQKALPMPS